MKEINEIRLQELFMKIVNIKSLLHDLNIEDLNFTDQEWETLSLLFKK